MNGLGKLFDQLQALSLDPAEEVLGGSQDRLGEIVVTVADLKAGIAGGVSGVGELLAGVSSMEGVYAPSLEALSGVGWMLNELGCLLIWLDEVEVQAETIVRRRSRECIRRDGSDLRGTVTHEERSLRRGVGVVREECGSAEAGAGVEA